jgi:hypothetical protein
MLGSFCSTQIGIVGRQGAAFPVLAVPSLEGLVDAEPYRPRPWELEAPGFRSQGLGSLGTRVGGLTTSAWHLAVSTILGFTWDFLVFLLSYRPRVLWPSALDNDKCYSTSWLGLCCSMLLLLCGTLQLPLVTTAAVTVATSLLLPPSLPYCSASASIALYMYQLSPLYI